MNIVKIYGGMGNQMFQYSFGRVLEEYGRDVAYDTSWYNTKAATDPAYLRFFRLDKFQITNLKLHPFISKNSFVYERRVGYNLNLFQLRNDNNFQGYWQYYSYYERIMPFLRKEFQLRTEVYTDEFLKLADIIMDTNSVSVHVRRGDYLLNRKGIFHDLPAKYYFNAIRETEGDLFIFSDDILWCKETFKKEYFDRKITFVDVEDYLALELMKFCKHNILSNSTFGMWAALLNENPGRKVYCPTRFLGDELGFSDQYRYPKDWIKINDYTFSLEEKVNIE
jgi:hypothetical protein